MTVNTKCQSKTGFTLIELLVVVLIIGILAAVALPQYEKAVLKSRYATMQAVVRSLKNAAERTFLVSGSYPTSWDDMDISLPAEFAGKLNAMDFFENDKMSIDLYRGSEKDIVGYIPNHPYTTATIAFCLWLEHSAYPNRQECWAYVDSRAANEICLASGGVKRGTISEQSRSFNAYILQ